MQKLFSTLFIITLFTGSALQAATPPWNQTRIQPPGISEETFGPGPQSVSASANGFDLSLSSDSTRPDQEVSIYGSAGWFSIDVATPGIVTSSPSYQYVLPWLRFNETPSILTVDFTGNSFAPGQAFAIGGLVRSNSDIPGSLGAMTVTGIQTTSGLAASVDVTSYAVDLFSPDWDFSLALEYNTPGQLVANSTVITIDDTGYVPGTYVYSDAIFFRNDGAESITQLTFSINTDVLDAGGREFFAYLAQTEGGSITPVPEPETYLALGSFLAIAVFAAYRKRAKDAKLSRRPKPN